MAPTNKLNMNRFIESSFAGVAALRVSGANRRQVFCSRAGRWSLHFLVHREGVGVTGFTENFFEAVYG
jgi:hypothetical protein